jgi:hypothetical protein
MFLLNTNAAHAHNIATLPSCLRSQKKTARSFEIGGGVFGQESEMRYMLALNKNAAHAHNMNVCLKEFG